MALRGSFVTTSGAMSSRMSDQLSLETCIVDSPALLVSTGSVYGGKGEGDVSDGGVHCVC